MLAHSRLPCEVPVRLARRGIPELAEKQTSQAFRDYFRIADNPDRMPICLRKDLNGEMLMK